MGYFPGLELNLYFHYTFFMSQRSTIPAFPRLSRRAFWDTDLHSLDFDRYADFIITRVFERGSLTDKQVLIDYYGRDKITRTLTSARSLLSIAQESAKQLLHLSDQDFACYRSTQPATRYSRY
jgi:hypothetical protein